MSRPNKRNRNKQLNRAAAQLLTPVYSPGGATMYVPSGYQQSILGQTYYGSSLKNVPVSQSALFSPGLPLPTQPNVDPQGKPVQFRFPVAYNTFPVDRSLGSPDIPSFEQLRRLAKMYSGITLNERYWLDMVPRMTLDIRLKKEYVDQGAKPSQYQKEITYFKKFWEKPDGRQDIHTWLRMALREQTQIDELYLYKNRTRGRKLLGLWIVAGDQMKPLLDDWGMLPEAPNYAYQQYPWGIPGMQYSIDQMIHYQETPAADSPFGFSRVERFILEVNQALRKKKKDLANFTEGNIPQSFMEVPESSNWTPDQIDSFEQSWNTLLAGNLQQQVRIKFMQPGMKYTPAEQYEITFDPDLFLFKIACGCYGVPVTEFGFTEDSNRSSGESQEDMVYRRTIGPNASTYGRIITRCTNEDFPPEMHGEMFEAVFGGYEELEDENEKATANTTYTSAGVLGLTDAAKLAQLPIDPNATPVGRIYATQNGPLFLDDQEFMAAWRGAQMAGFKMAANPPEPDDTSPSDQKPDSPAVMSRVVEALERAEEAMRLMRARNTTEEVHEQRTQSNTEDQAQCGTDAERATGHDVGGRPREEDQSDAGRGQDRTKTVGAEYRRWRERAIQDIKTHKAVQRGFTTTLIPEPIHMVISRSLAHCVTVDHVRTLFDRVRDVPESELHGGESLLEYHPEWDIWQPANVAHQLEQYRARGVKMLRWVTGVSKTGVCQICEKNKGEVRAVGQRFSNGAYLPGCHFYCECAVEEVVGDE